MLSKVKLALRISTTDFDSQLNELIEAATQDLQLAGILATDDDVLFRQAIITYVALHFGEPTEYDRLKKSYDEQKAQLKMSRRYNG